MFDEAYASFAKDNIQEFQAKSVISVVEMKYEVDGDDVEGVYTMNADYLDHAMTFFKDLTDQAREERADTTRRKRVREENAVAEKASNISNMVPGYSTTATDRAIRASKRQKS